MLGNLNLQSNLKVHNYDTNKQQIFWLMISNGHLMISFLTQKLKTQFLGNLKNINYEAKNIDIYKKDIQMKYSVHLDYYLK